MPAARERDQFTSSFFVFYLASADGMCSSRADLSSLVHSDANIHTEIMLYLFSGYSFIQLS
jgi:hypothetical protein